MEEAADEDEDEDENDERRLLNRRLGNVKSVTPDASL